MVPQQSVILKQNLNMTPFSFPYHTTTDDYRVELKEMFYLDVTDGGLSESGTHQPTHPPLTPQKKKILQNRIFKFHSS